MSEEVAPENIELERNLLSAIFTRPEVLAELRDALKPHDFYIRGHGVIYALMILAVDQGLTPDTAIILDLAKRTDQEAVIGGRRELHFIANWKAAWNDQPLSYAERIREYARLRKLGELCLTKEASTRSGMLPSAYIADELNLELQQFLAGEFTSEFQTLGTGNAEYLAQLKSDAREVAELKAAGKPLRSMRGLSIGLSDANRYLAGLRNGQFIVIAARPACGKSAMALQVAESLAEDGIPVGFFSLEMSQDEIRERSLIRGLTYTVGEQLFTICNRHLSTPDFTPSQMAMIERRLDRLARLPIYIQDCGTLRMADLRLQAANLKAKHGVKLIILDYLQLLTEPPGCERQPMVQKVTEFSKGLKALAVDLNLPVLALSQLNRAVETDKDNRRPVLSDLRESGAIEQDANIVMFLHRQRYKHENDRPVMEPVELIIAKNRNGPTGIVDLLWHRESFTFHQIARDEPSRRDRADSSG
ncbi:MAG TPA: DnaB-like helicase C-terminal domain-containing protein [Dissulfurispiraceae bacterium]|nr:DnaB-like helicase C-terminal domain-containing protein [Dissulfurispiraceae bacterium]